MAYTEADRVQIRHFMGGGALFHGLYPLLESAMVTTQSIADGGSQVDSSTETAIKATVTSCITLETQLANLWSKMLAGTVDEIKIDPPRAMAALRMEGRRLSGSLARYLGFNAALSDVWSAATPHVPPVIGPDLLRS